MAGKRLKAANAQIDRTRLYQPLDAVRLLKSLEGAKFDEAVEVHFRLGLNVRHADQQLRGSLMLPHATSRTKTVADGLAAPMAGAMTYEAVRRYVDDVVVVSDDEIVSAMRDLMLYAKLVVEPAAAAGIAALATGRVRAEPGSDVVVVVSGGNVDLERLKALL